MSTADLHDSLVDFVYYENRLLDNRQFGLWYDLFADDGVYWMPSQPGQTDRETQASISLEDKMLLKLRIERYEHPRAYSLQPQVRGMRVVQRPEIESAKAGDGLPAVSCNVIYMEYQAGNPLVLGARVRYCLRQVEGQLRIVEKKVELLNMDSFLPAIQLFI